MGWLALAVVVGLSICIFAAAIVIAETNRRAEALSVVAMASAQEVLQGLRAASASAIISDSHWSQAVTEMSVQLNEIRTVLQRGGPLLPGDAVGARALSSLPGVQWPGIAASLDAAVSSARSFQDYTRGLQAASVARAQLPAHRQRLAEALAQLQRFSELSNTQALQAVLIDINQLDAARINSIFGLESIDAGQQDALIARWETHVGQAAAWAATAGNPSADWPAHARAGARDLATASRSWLEHLNALKMAVPYRDAAWKALPQAQETWGQARADLKQAELTALQNMGRWLVADLVAWMALLVCLSSTLIWARWGWRNSAQRWSLSQDHLSLAETQDQLDHLARSLRAVVDRDGEVVQGLRLQDDPASGTFALTTMVNRMLESRERLGKQGLSNVDMIDSYWSRLNAAWADAGWSHGPMAWESMEALLSSTLRRLAAVTSETTASRQSLEAVRVSIGDGAGLAQESVGRNETLRSRLQMGAKRVKRQGEATQKTHAQVQALRLLAGRVRVLSMNAAIAAAGLGDPGREFGAMADEIHRLAETVGNALVDMEQVVEELIHEAHETSGVLEQGVSEVLDAGQLSTRLLSLLEAGHGRLTEVEQLWLRALASIRLLGADLEQHELPTTEALVIARRLRDFGAQGGRWLADANREARQWRQDIEELLKRL